MLGIQCPEDSKAPNRFVHDTSFADDDMFPVFSHAPEIASKTSAACAVIDNRFSRFGLIVNYARGTLLALARTMQELPFGKVLMLLSNLLMIEVLRKRLE